MNIEKVFSYLKELKLFLLYVWVICSLLGLAFSTNSTHMIAAMTSLVLSAIFTTFEEQKDE